MFAALADLWKSLRPPRIKQVFFPSLRFNRRVAFWYADRVVGNGSVVEGVQHLSAADSFRKKGKALTFICNHLTYADSHVIEVLLIRKGYADLAAHLIHIAGQKTYAFIRRPFTRSLSTVRVYQSKAEVDKALSRKMNSRALKWAAHQKRRGYSLLVFPEGTRTRRPRRFNLYSANPKSTLYFRKSFVVPLALMGSEEILPLGKTIPRPANVKLRVGQPLDHASEEERYKRNNPQRTEREMRHDLMLMYMRKINELLDPQYRHEQ